MTTTAAPVTAEFGRARKRKEDARLITGRTHWTDNISLLRMLHIAVVRSPLAHATITGINTDAARQLPGVHGVFTATDLGAEDISLPCAWPITADMKAPKAPPLASGTVHFAGEGVALVVARDAAAAQDAADAVEVGYDRLEPVLDMEAALAEGATLVHPELGTNRNALWVFDSGEAGSGGSAADAIAAAESDPDSIVVQRRFRQQRLIPAFMEPRSVVVDPTGEQLTMWSSTQVPHILKTMIALTLGLPEHKVRVIAPDVGGGFGGKLQVTPEEMLAVLVARRMGKPVKWTETRSECMVAAHHGRDQIQDLTLAARRDGTVTALKVELLADMGAYLRIITPGIPILGAFMFNGIYKFPAYRFACTNVFTTKTPTDAYRGAGRPEATFGIERMMDELAVELGMEPLELRQRNWITHDEFPYTTVSTLTYDTGNYEAATAKAKELFDYDGLRAEQRRRREANDPVQLGARQHPDAGHRQSRGGHRVLPARPGSRDGLEPGGVRPVGGAVRGHRGAARRYPELGPGLRHLRLAAHLFECAEHDIEFDSGTFTIKGTDRSMTIQQIAFAVFAAHDYPADMEPSLDSEATFDPMSLSFPHGTHLCAAEVDTETGWVKIHRYVCVDDIGTVINPLIVEGQVHGGLAQGIAQALFEEAVYDEGGTLITATLADYLVPSAADLPHFTTDRTETPSTTNALGVKGVGEAGTIASTPAVVNAVLDAVRHLGVTDIPMPCTPQRVWRAVQSARGSVTSNAPGGAR